MDIKKVLAEPVDLKIEDKTKPTILIYHTHTTESYQMLDTDWFTKSYQTRSNLATRNMVRVGDEIVAQLEAAGFAVIHDTKIYDATYNGAYYRSEDAIEAYQKNTRSFRCCLIFTETRFRPTIQPESSRWPRSMGKSRADHDYIRL